MSLERGRGLMALAVAAIVVGVAVWLLSQRSAISEANADRIACGMTLAEVETIFGGPARDTTTGPVSLEGVDGIPIPQGDGNQHEAGLEDEHQELIGWQRRWLSNTVFVTIWFDRDNRVTKTRSRPLFRVERSLWETVRSGLRL
jgi:hypothetical protein